MSSLEQLESQLNQIILGKAETIRLVMVCLLSRGHILLEDFPGTGKTTLAKALASSIDLDYKRVQFAADMLPSDIIGGMIYDQKSQIFILQKGPVFTQLLLADEINRASAKTQSALLEAMEEHQISIERETISLEAPFFVIATQNPIEQEGTFDLPESQLDRFQMRLSLGYLDEVSEISVFLEKKRSEIITELSPVITADELISFQSQASEIHLSPSIAQYIHHLLSYTRESNQFIYGLSTRAGIAIIGSAKAYAFLCGEKAVLPEHIQSVFIPCVLHRILPREINLSMTLSNNKMLLAKKVLAKVPIPL